jgi:LysM repeat protein
MQEKIVVWKAMLSLRLAGFRPGSLVRLAALLTALFLIVSFTAVGISSLFSPGGIGPSGGPSFTEGQKENFCRKALMLSRLPGLTVTEYEVRPGDNFWKIGRDFGVDVHTVVGANPWLTDFFAAVGQKLIVPDRKGVLHAVRRGETLGSIARLYGVSSGVIIAANGGLLFGFCSSGRVLFVPGAMPKVTSEKIRAYYERRKIFCSPIAGAYTSGFGWRVHPVTKARSFHTGLDLRARVGTVVCAAGSGTVVAAYEMSGYGKCVIIAHGNGLMTLYGHNSSLRVHNGQHVVKGQCIARSGKSGTATGPHLHFEVRRNGKPEDPAMYLW